MTVLPGRECPKCGQQLPPSRIDGEIHTYAVCRCMVQVLQPRVDEVDPLAEELPRYVPIRWVTREYINGLGHRVIEDFPVYPPTE